ncbi:hypothetical protein MHPYR_180114 [uncultured Mycobacterium sp.]|uniref:Uncharacterized protein n=1 Tax=uncultured Mycobacterium sp. TaxID=171292 RepID=A0A1Y5P5F4_9MYCO|nr:hypothetical protein MHPYR_180114 [uncultured Mycobacterium sp.]
MSVKQDLPGALHLRDIVQGIASDPDLDQTAKLFAFCLAAYLTSPERREVKRTGKGQNWAQAVGEMMAGARGEVVLGQDMNVWRVRRVIANDIPRYQISFRRVTCAVLKTRGPNAGKPCGKNATHSWVERNPETGEGAHVGFCTAHVTRADQLRRRDVYQQWEANGKPCPPANTGGVLARYFRANWAKLYAWADPSIEPLPGGKPPTPPRPTFTLIQGGAAS